MGGTISRRRAVGGCLLALVVAAVALALSSGTAGALAPPTPWNGVNPFRCVVQDAGQGTTVPDPGADPYCVRFDKTNQNVTQLGLITFLTKEPARVDAAAPKCFYYQEDHWRGSVIQSDQQSVIYEFYGHYFFNKATGDGGVWVTGFTLAGQTFDPRSLPGFPPQYDQYFGPGTGGFITHDDVPADPSCAAQANQSPGAIYRAPAAHCLRVHGKVGRRFLGPVRLGMSEGRVRNRLGRPEATTRSGLSYCLSSGGALFVGGRGRPRTRAPVVIALTTGRAVMLGGGHGVVIRVGANLGRLRRAFPGTRVMFRLGRGLVYAVSAGGADRLARPGGMVIAGVAVGRITWLGSYDPTAVRGHRALAGYLRQVR